MNKLIAILLCFISLSCFAATPDDHCMAIAVYSEASKTITADQRGVYQVIVNRMHRSDKTACEVIKEPRQFSFVSTRTNWTASRKQLSKLCEIEAMPKLFSSNVLYFHNTSVRPKWSYKFRLVYSVGNHKYYAIK